MKDLKSTKSTLTQEELHSLREHVNDSVWNLQTTCYQANKKDISLFQEILLSYWDELEMLMKKTNDTMLYITHTIERLNDLLGNQDVDSMSTHVVLSAYIEDQKQGMQRSKSILNEYIIKISKLVELLEEKEVI